MVYDMDTDIQKLFISPNPGEFRRLQPKFYGVYQIQENYLNFDFHICE